MYEIINMSTLTTLGIGGKARVYKVSSLNGLDDLLGCDGIAWGNGSNVLVSDYGITQPVLYNRLTSFEFEGTLLKAQSGCSISRLALNSAKRGLSGLEWAYMLPATVGGATVMNAGAFGKSVSDCVLEVEVFRNGRVMTLSRSDCGFSYRKSNFLKSDFIISVTFKLEQSNEQDCRELIASTQLKRNCQPKGKSAGCVYKAVGQGSGYYIDKAGLKGEREGDIYVSPIHAGFFINAGNGTAKQMLTLMQRVEKRVESEFGIKLEREILLIGDF